MLAAILCLFSLFQQQNQLRERIFTLSHKLSAMSFGQDRYRRRYWVLPKSGGIFVEGLESGEPESSDLNAPEIDKKMEEQSVDEEKHFKPVTPPDASDEGSVKVAEVDNNAFTCETKVKTDVTLQSTFGSSDSHDTNLPVCVEMFTQSDIHKNEGSVVKEENGHAESKDQNLLKAELVSLNCLIGDNVKMNGEVSRVDCRNGFVDLTNCIRSDGDDVKADTLPVVSPATVSDPKQGNLVEDSGVDSEVKVPPAAELQLISVAPANQCESAETGWLSSSLCCKTDDDHLPATPNKDDISLLQQSTLLQLAVSDAGLAQSAVTDSQCYSIASSQRTSQVATPSSEVGTTPQLDMSTAATPVSLMQSSRTSTPAYLSTSFADDLQRSADGELQPDYLAVPQNVQPISLGNFFVSEFVRILLFG